MRAAVLRATEQLELVEMAMPDPPTGEQVLVRVRAVGICGSEVHAFQGTHPFRKAPVVLGHEMSGDVVSTGSEVTDLSPGERVAVDPQWTCGTCEYCRRGDVNLCPSKKVLGTSVWPGAFGEYVVVPRRSVFRLPDTLTYVEGALLEPMTIAVHVARRAGLTSAMSAAILGVGSIGGLLAGICRMQGADPVIAVDIHQHCLDTAVDRMGATHGILMPIPDLLEQVIGLSGGEGIDVVFVTADDVALAERAVQMTKRRGKIVLVALLTERPIQLRAYDLIAKELQVLGSTMCNHGDVQIAMELAERHQVKLSAIATHVLPIKEAGYAMELARTKKDGAIKVLLSFGDS